MRKGIGDKLQRTSQNIAKKKILLLGGTGSIGLGTLDVIKCNSDEFELWAISAHSRHEEVAAIAREFRPKYVCLTNGHTRSKVSQDLADCPEVEVLAGMDNLCRLAADDEVDIVVSAIVGAAALRPTLAAASAGKRIALANKEALVMAGTLFNRLAIENNAEVIPVDSEHSAVFSCLHGKPVADVKSLTLTASGGPFRTWDISRFDSITPSAALKHPTWDMGAKITIDSATMFNKALEVIEAHYLFGIPYDGIKVLVHPQSIVHAMVQYSDNSTLAQLSVPDMRLPIQLALTWPKRIASPAPEMNLARLSSLEFFEVDERKFPSIAIGYKAGKRGGTATTALNAANEVAVNRFLQREIQFSRIFEIVSEVTENTPWYPADTLEEIISADTQAREKASRM